MKQLKKIISILIIILILIIGVMISVAYLYKEDVKKYAVRELNKRLKTEIKAQKISFSVFKQFPNASLVLENVLIKSTKDIIQSDFKENIDTLCFAKEISLNFNIINVLKKQYYINNISIYNGLINILTDNNENVNYKIWDDNKTDDTSDFTLELNKINLSQINIKYISLPKKIYFSTFSKETEFKGKFSSKDYELFTKGEFLIEKILIDQTSYLEKQSVFLKTNFIVNENEYTINAGEITIADLNFNIMGQFKQEEKASYIDMELRAKDLDINSFFSILPKHFGKDIEKIKSTGQFYLNIKVKGLINNSTNPLLKAHFGVQNAALTLDDYKVDKLFAEGYFTNGIRKCPTTSFITFDSIYAKIDENSICVKGYINNFKSPDIHIYTRSNLKLKFINKLIHSETITLTNGSLFSDIEINGRVSNLSNISKKDIAKLTYNGKSRIINGGILINKNNIFINNISGKVLIDRHYKISTMNLTVKEDNFTCKGTLSNVLPYFLFEKEKLWLDLKVDANQINLSNYLIDSSYVSEAKEDTITNFPENIFLKLHFKTNKILYKRFVADNLQTQISYKPKIIVVHSFQMKTMGGKINGGGALLQRFNKDFIFKTQSKIDDINLKTLFTTFNNFGQDELQAKHINGSLSGEVDLYSIWDNKFNIIEDKLVVSSDILVMNGELLNFEPMYGLSNFIKLNELKDVHFSTLQNEIIIKDKQIIIPEMEIISSAFNISGSGTHNFDNSYSYKVRVLLSDVLFNKAKTHKKDIVDHAMIEDDGLGKTSIYLSIKGKDDEYKVSYDKIALKNKIKSDLKLQKKELREILKEEFGLFKNETITKENNKLPYNIIWDKDNNNDKLKDSSKVIENKNIEKLKVEWDDF